MTTKPFLDTNVLIYAFIETSPLRDAARQVVLSGGVFSVQVANEFVDVSRRKLRWSWNEAGQALESIRVFLGPPLALTDDIHRGALALSRRFGFRIYESLVVAAAHRAGCRVLYSEDLQHGQVVDGVEIRNPFLPA